MSTTQRHHSQKSARETRNTGSAHPASTKSDKALRENKDHMTDTRSLAVVLVMPVREALFGSATVFGDNKDKPLGSGETEAK